MGWLARWRRKNPGAPLWNLIAWDCVGRPISYAILKVCWGHRWWGLENVPDTGPVLLLSNHQSYVDLIAVGVPFTRRHFHSMARKGLFKNPVFGWWIRSLNAFSVDQDGADIRALRSAIDKLKAGHALLVFPEGSRTDDGTVGGFQPGLMLLIRRARPTIVPAAVDGCFDAWPRGGKPSGNARTGVVFGEPIAAADLLAQSPEEAIQTLRSRITALQMDCRKRLREVHAGRYPRHNDLIDGPPA